MSMVVLLLVVHLPAIADRVCYKIKPVYYVCTNVPNLGAEPPLAFMGMTSLTVDFERLVSYRA